MISSWPGVVPRLDVDFGFDGNDGAVIITSSPRWRAVANQYGVGAYGSRAIS